MGIDKTAKVPLPDAPLTAKGKVNFNAWAKKTIEAKHPWVTKCEVLVKQDMEKVTKSVAGLE